MKTCICCTRTLPVERFAIRNRNGGQSRMGRCDQCQKGYDAVRYRLRNTKPEPGERPTYYRAKAQKELDKLFDAWDVAINPAPLRWAA